MIITATQIKISGIAGYLRFIPLVWNIRKQLSAAEGLVFVRLQGLRTLTGWEDAEAMRVFRNNGYHLEAMKNISRIGKARSVSWEAEAEPGWDEANVKLAGVPF